MEQVITIIRTKSDFRSLAGLLKSKVKLSDAEIKKARQAFTKKWPRKI
jgi:hypothetical protein